MHRIHITPQGYQALKDELDHLWYVERPEITRSVSEAAAQGDRSENAEYIYGKKRLREIDRRVRFLRNRMEMLDVVHQRPVRTDRVYFSAWVAISALEHEEELLFRIVGPDEINPKRNWFSYQAPMARALLGRAVGDEVWIDRPAGRALFEVVAIHYDPPS